MTDFIYKVGRRIIYIRISIPCLHTLFNDGNFRVRLGEPSKRRVIPPGLVEVQPIPLFALTGVAIVGQPGAFLVAILAPGHVAQALHHPTAGVHQLGQAAQVVAQQVEDT